MKWTILWRRLAIALSLALAGCVAIDNRAVETAEWDRSKAHPALWRVSDKDTTIYLFGSMHLLKPDVVWFDGPVKRAFDASQELVVEMVPPDQATMQAVLMDKGLRKDGKSLREVLTPEQRAAVENALAEAKLKPTAVDKMEPWLAALTLTTAPMTGKGFATGSGVEQVIQAAAKARAMPVTGLETYAQQIGFFAALNEAEQVRFLMATIGAKDDGAKGGALDLDRIERSWATGDVNDTARLINESVAATPEVGKVMLGNRNANWAEWIAQRLKTPGRVFVAVGAGHLAGPGSVQAALQAKGLATRRVQ